MPLSTISARIDTADKIAFDAFCTRMGLNTSAAINLFVKTVIRDDRMPFELTLPADVSLEEGKNAFRALREEAQQKGLQDMSLDEINEEIAAARKSLG